jgi:hypothetical protein
MCVPCAAALPGLGEVLLFLLVVLGVLCWKAAKALPYVGIGLAVVAVALYRWLSGAVLSKPLRRTDDEHWDTAIRQGQRRPRFTRSVRAAGRILVTALIVGGLWNWVITALVAGSLSLTVSGVALYRRRDRVITTCRELTGRTRQMIGAGR